MEPNEKEASLIYTLAPALLFLILLRVTGTLTPDFNPINFENLKALAFAAETSASDIYNQLFWLGVTAGATICVCVRPEVLARHLRFFYPLAILLLFCLASSLWATHPAISVRRSILLVTGAYSTVVAVIYCRDTTTALRAVYLAFGVSLLLNAATLAFPFSFDSRNLFRGALGDKNFLGVVAAMGLAIGLTWGLTLRSLPMRLLNTAFVFTWGFLLAITGAKTAIALCLALPPACVLLTWLISRSRVPLHAVLTLLAAILAILLPFLVFAVDLDPPTIVSFVVADVSFTGRDVIWQFILDQFSSRWLLGFGYGSFWGVGLDAPNLKAEYNFIRLLTQAHNGYLDVLLSIGPIGLLLLLVFLFNIAVLVGRTRRWNPPLYNFGLFVFFFTLIHNLTDSNLVRGVSCLWIMLVFLASAAAREQGAA